MRLTVRRRISGMALRCRRAVARVARLAACSGAERFTMPDRQGREGERAVGSRGETAGLPSHAGALAWGAMRTSMNGDQDTW
jgi:hypothetical protein